MLAFVDTRTPLIRITLVSGPAAALRAKCDRSAAVADATFKM
jgi:hypothetical protein